MRLVLLLALIFLGGCGQAQDQTQVQKAPKEQEETLADFETIKDFLEEKLEGEILIRDYGEDSGKTKIVFEKDGSFHGDYFGKITSDGQDYGLTWLAQSKYGAEEIHTSDFRGIFEITEMLDEYTYKLDLRDYKITSEVGPYEDIYYSVDFALGLDPEEDYILYRPGASIGKLIQDEELLAIARDHSPDGEKIKGFIIYSPGTKEVFYQN